MAIRTCFFDMGNVLVHFSHDRMCENIANLSGLDVPTIKSFLMNDGRQWAMERGEMSEEDFGRELQSIATKPFSLPELQHAAANIFWLNDSIVPILQQLRSRGIRLILLSNTSITHLRFIEREFDVLNYMDDRVASFEVGVMKPDARIFEVALEKAGNDPSECFYTDDIAPYIAQATSMGIHSALYTSTPELITAMKKAGAL